MLTDQVFDDFLQLMFEGAVVLALLIGIFKLLRFLGFGRKSKLEKLDEAGEQLQQEFYEKLEEEKMKKEDQTSKRNG